MEGNSALSLLTSVVPFLVIFAIFYFLFIRPQRNQQKKHKEMLEALKAGDKVVAYGGFICEIVKREDTYFLVKISENVNVKLMKEYISQKLDS